MIRPVSIEEMCMNLKPIIGNDADKLYSRYRLATTIKEKVEIEQLINAIYNKNIGSLLDKKILLSPPTNDLNADHPIGIIKYVDKDIGIFGLRDKDWVRHVLISGMSGSGKTNLAFHIIGNFIVKNKPFLVLDWKKSFRPLLTMSDEIYCFTVGNEKVSNYFRTNINVPPENIPAKEWVNIICDIITEAFNASYGVHKILSETMDAAFRRFGVYKGEINYPTWYDIKEMLEEKVDIYKGRNAEWLASALRVAHVLTFGSFGNAVNDKNSTFKIEDLFDKKVIFELNSLNHAEKKFFAQYLLTYIYKLKKSSDNQSTENFIYAIVVDEAHNIFLKQDTMYMSENITDMIYREVREYGISLVCLDQHVSKLSDTVAGNSATIIAFQQILPADVEVVSKTMLLSENKYYFSLLPVGYGIVKLAERYNEPFLIKVPLVNLKKELIGDAKIKSLMESKLGFYDEVVEDGKQEEEKVQRDEEVERVLRVRIKELLDKKYQLHDIKNYFKDRFDKNLIEKVIKTFDIQKSYDELFLEYVRNNPGCMITQIYNSLDVSARKGNDLKKKLELSGLIEIKQESTQKGMKKKVYLTQRGIDLT